MQEKRKVWITIGVALFFVLLYAGAARYFRHVDEPTVPVTKVDNKKPSFVHNELSPKEDVGPAVDDPTKG